MNRFNRAIAGLLLLLAGPQLWAQPSLHNSYWNIHFRQDGTMSRLLTLSHGTWDSVSLAKNDHSGVSWYVNQNGVRQPIRLARYAQNAYDGNFKGIRVGLRYGLNDDKLIIKAVATNTTGQVFRPEKLGLDMGISHYMSAYPQWDAIYFPTMLRCEKTHFWGYMMSPDGRLLGLASPDPVASWSLNYNFGYGDRQVFFWGHRIYSMNLDLLNTAPLPDRHPQDLTRLAPGETRRWTIVLVAVSAPNRVQPVLSRICQAPMIQLKQTTLEPGKTFTIFADHNQGHALRVFSPSGRTWRLRPIRSWADRDEFLFDPGTVAGVYTLVATSHHRITEAKVTIRKPWGWYLRAARDAALQDTQKASYNCESWYGFYSAYLAQQYYPDRRKRQQTDERFGKVIGLMYDTVAGRPLAMTNASRIQNTSTTIGILVDKYRAEGQGSDLILAKKLADRVILQAQSTDGAYRNGKTHYTSVIYIAKSILELAAAEKERGRTDTAWYAAYLRHLRSAKKAVDQLMLGIGAIATEGESTFEDGMVSCTALQIADFALLQDDPKDRARYAQMAEAYLTAHRCLTQLIVPDSRQRNGTLRFWEAQYDVMMGDNMMSSPHGWSAWRAYATYYLYLLTGKEDYLLQTMNAVGTCVQMIDARTGHLRWAFVVDPYVNTVQSCENFPNTGADTYNANQFKAQEGRTRPRIIGEEFVDMVAGWFHANSSDNDVHEIFKCMEEVALGKAYIFERADGGLLAYNCRVVKKGDRLSVTSVDDRLSRIHLNLKNRYILKIAGWPQQTSGPGMTWVSKNKADPVLKKQPAHPRKESTS